MLAKNYSMDLIDKTIASLQPNVSPGPYNLKLQANEINFENRSAQHYFKNPYIAIRFNLLHFCPSVRSFVFAAGVIEMFFAILSGYFYISPNFMAVSYA